MSKIALTATNADIINAINSKGEYAVTDTATLYAANWANSTYVLSVSALGANDIIFLKPASTADKALYEAAEIFDVASTGAVTFTATTTPTSNINMVYCIIRGA